MKILKAGALYFGIVFGAGFVLGSVRILWVGRTGEGQAGIHASVEHTNRVKEDPTLFTISLFLKEFFV